MIGDQVYEKQDKCCKRCGYIEYENRGSLIASMKVVEYISKEPIKPIKCDICNKKMQIYYQENHRRFYKCWNCNTMSCDDIFYESEQENYLDEMKRLGY